MYKAFNSLNFSSRRLEINYISANTISNIIKNIIFCFIERVSLNNWFALSAFPFVILKVNLFWRFFLYKTCTFIQVRENARCSYFFDYPNICRSNAQKKILHNSVFPRRVRGALNWRFVWLANFRYQAEQFFCWRVDVFFISLVYEIKLKIHPARLVSARTALSFLFARPLISARAHASEFPGKTNAACSIMTAEA